MEDYPEALESDPDGVSTALEVGATFWFRGDHADALRWLRKAVDAAFDEGADERGLELSKVAATLATRVPTWVPTTQPPTGPARAPEAPRTPIPEPLSAPHEASRVAAPSGSEEDRETHGAQEAPPTARVEAQGEPPTTTTSDAAPVAPREKPSGSSGGTDSPAARTEGDETTGRVSGLPLPRLTGRAARFSSTTAPGSPSATRTVQGLGAQPASLLTPFARVPPRVATPARATETGTAGDPASSEPEGLQPPDTTGTVSRADRKEGSTPPSRDPAIEALVHSAFPDPVEAPVATPEPRRRFRTRLWNATDAIRVAVSREGERCVVRVFDGSDLRDGEVEAVMIGLDGGLELADMLRVAGDTEISASRRD